MLQDAIIDTNIEKNSKEYHKINNEIMFFLSNKYYVLYEMKKLKYNQKLKMSNISINLNRTKAIVNFYRLRNYISLKNIQNTMYVLKQDFNILTYSNMSNDYELTINGAAYLLLHEGYHENSIDIVVHNMRESNDKARIFTIELPCYEILELPTISRILNTHIDEITKNNNFMCEICYKRYYRNQDDIVYCNNCGKYIDGRCYNRLLTSDCPFCRSNPSLKINALMACYINMENTMFKEVVDMYDIMFTKFKNKYSEQVNENEDSVDLYSIYKNIEINIHNDFE